MTSLAIIRARLRGAAVRAHLRRADGPGTGYPESMTAELDTPAEEWLAVTDHQLWPSHAAGWRLHADYLFRHEGGHDDQP